MIVLWLSSVVLLSILGYAEAMCGCCVQTVCTPPPPPCPPPVICPMPEPCRCPAPQPCSCPPPPPPPPPCMPACMPPPMLPPPPPPPMVENTCCVMCYDPCAFRARKRRDVSQADFELALNKTLDDPVCNNLELKKIMLDNIDEGTTTSRKKIKTVAEAKFNDKFMVMCARGEFAYSAYTHSYCQVRKGDLTCYAFVAADNLLD